MKVAVGSPNPVKIDAVRSAFSHYYEDLEIVSFDVDSGVKVFPDDERLILDGAMNRARAAREACPDCGYAVGIEGGVVFFGGRWFDRSYVVVLRGGEVGVGCSCGYEIPDHLVTGLDSFSDDSKQVIDEVVGVKDVFSKQGMVGVVSRNVIDRRDILHDAVVCGLTQFLVPSFYEK